MCYLQKRMCGHCYLVMGIGGSYCKRTKANEEEKRLHARLDNRRNSLRCRSKNVAKMRHGCQFINEDVTA